MYGILLCVINMDIKLYNILSRKKEIFKPLKNKKAGLYTCGPTVYNPAHIGNLRTYIFEDVLKRILIYNGYGIKHVMNITDVEDKIIKKAQTEGKTLKETTGPFVKIFFEDIKKMNILKADAYPRATETIKEITRLIAVLLKNGYAYKGSDGSIYFDISKFKNYGLLSGLKTKKRKRDGRISADEYGKKEAVDFALWKAARPKEPSWPSPFGNGRPGWHIECSAMSMKYLGERFDIHCGAVDLIFPHHENEIAQSEAATGKKFVNYWIEGEHLLANGRKMSKSLGNFYTLRDIEKRGFNPLSFRYLILTSHYRSQLNFTWESLKSAQNALDNLTDALNEARLRSLAERNRASFGNEAKNLEKRFLKTINDDLNMPKALAILWDVARHSGISSREKRKLLLKFDEVLGLGLKNTKKTTVPIEIKKIVKTREYLRKKKSWREADEIRKELAKKGWMLEDTKEGIKISKMKN